MKVPVQQHDSASDHSTLEWTVSLLFWSQMLIAASLYGLVALSPKLLSYIDLQGEHFKRQSQLVSLENGTVNTPMIGDGVYGGVAFALAFAATAFCGGSCGLNT